MSCFPLDCLRDVCAYCDTRTICRLLCTSKFARSMSKHGSAFKHVYTMLGIHVPFRYSIFRQVVQALLTGNVHAIYFHSLFARVLVVYKDGRVETCRGHTFHTYANLRDSCVDDEGDLLVCTTSGTYSTADMSIVAAPAGRMAFNYATSQLVTVGFDKVLRRSWQMNGFYVSHQPGPIVHMRRYDGHMIVLTNGAVVAQVDSYIAIIMGLTCIHHNEASIYWIVGPYKGNTFLIGRSDGIVTRYSCKGKYVSCTRWNNGVMSMHRPIVVGDCAISGTSVLHVPSMTVTCVV